MIVGNGQLADIFEDFIDEESILFASGVSDSNCKDESDFEREKKLLEETLKNSPSKKFVYFSSCALSAPSYPKNLYYNHKLAMENLIKRYSTHYYIFRVPQLFGKLKSHKTLINFLYESITNNLNFKVYSAGYRYVIEINDLKKLVSAYLKESPSCITVDLANPYRYKVLDFVKTIETLSGIKANYELIDKSDGYLLQFDELLKFVEVNHLKINFSVDYFKNKIAVYINENSKKDI